MTLAILLFFQYCRGSPFDWQLLCGKQSVRKGCFTSAAREMHEKNTGFFVVVSNSQGSRKRSVHMDCYFFDERIKKDKEVVQEMEFILVVLFQHSSVTILQPASNIFETLAETFIAKSLHFITRKKRHMLLEVSEKSGQRRSWHWVSSALHEFCEAFISIEYYL